MYNGMLKICNISEDLLLKIYALMNFRENEIRYQNQKKKITQMTLTLVLILFLGLGLALYITLIIFINIFFITGCAVGS